MQQLSLSARPKHLDALVGQQKIVDAIRGHMKGGRVVKAWLFSGAKGSGKTSISRILSIALQCTHQEIFGAPCKECYARKSSFPIYELNCADKTGIDKMREALAGADYGVMSGARYKVYILDEVHMLSDSAQSITLKYLEDSPETTIFILCSTAPQNIQETLRSRCIDYQMVDLESDGIHKLTERLLRKVKSELSPERLAEELILRSICSPRLVAQAVEKYLAGLEPEDAARVTGGSAVDVRALTKAVVKGNWPDASALLQKAQSGDVNDIRLSLLAYLRRTLLETPELGMRGDAIAKAISGICALQKAENLVISAGLSAELYRLSSIFSKYKL